MLYIENTVLQKYNEKDISLSMELYRGIEYCNLHDIFLKSCIDNLGSNVFNIKKKYSRTISNLLSSWMFTLYSHYDFSDDPFFPTNYNYFDNLITTLNDYSSLYNIKDKKIKINNIINDLKSNYKIILDNLKKIKSKNIPDSNFKLTKNQIFQKRDDEDIEFYKFNINHNIKIESFKLKNILDNLIIPKDVYLNLNRKRKNLELIMMY